LSTDNAGRLVLLSDALGNTTGLTYDNLDRITQILNAINGTTSFSYDANGNLLSVTDANGNQTSYLYDSRNRVTSRTDGLRVTESYGWDGNSNLTSHTDRREKVTALQYDALNRVTFAGFGQSGSQYESTISYGWDAGNRLTGATDSIAGAISRQYSNGAPAYDGLDNLLQETTPQGTVSYTYDNASRRQTMQVAGQPQVSYTWDNANRLTGITQGSSAVGINYDNANRRTSLTLPNGVTVGYSVDNDSRITGLTYSAGSTQLGNLTYGYDADGRVTSKNGTLAAISLPNAVSGNTFNADNGMTAFNGITQIYDANGSLTNDGTNTYTWDARNHLTGISGAVAASFTYDAFGRRASKTIAGANTQFLYDGFDPVQEIQAGAPSANLLTGGRFDEYFTRTDSSNNVSTLLQDALGSTIGLVGSGQSIATNYTYQPFGATTAAGTANGNSYQFTGRENDGTGLYFYRARYYQPTFQRFVSQDPLGFLGGDPNLYAYVRANPVSGVDPFGLYCLSDAAINGIAGSAGGALAGGAALTEFGPVGIAVGTIVGGTAGGALGYWSNNAFGNEVTVGAVGGAATSLNAPASGLLGGGIGGAVTYGLQQAGAPDYASVPAGGAAGGAVGGAVAPVLDGVAGGAAAGAIKGGEIGLASGVAAVAVEKALKAGNNCPSCGNSQ